MKSLSIAALSVPSCVRLIPPRLGEGVCFCSLELFFNVYPEDPPSVSLILMNPSFHCALLGHPSILQNLHGFPQSDKREKMYPHCHRESPVPPGLCYILVTCLVSISLETHAFQMDLAKEGLSLGEVSQNGCLSFSPCSCTY